MVLGWDWKSYLTSWFLSTKQEITCTESQRKQLKTLDLRNHGLEDCATFIQLLSPEYLKTLKGLILKKNNLHEFPRTLAHSLEKVKYLMLDYNHIPDLPFDLRHMKKLSVLNVSHNDFTGLHFFHVVCQLTSLRVLWANCTGMSEIPKEISNLKLLRVLGLRKNNIKYLPDELFTLGNLRWLTLSSNEITEVPSAIKDLKRLVHLNLNYNRLNELPSSFVYLEKLEYLQVKHNFLTITDELVNFFTNIPLLKSCSVAGNLLDRRSNRFHGDVIIRTSNERRRASQGVLQSPINSPHESTYHSENSEIHEIYESSLSGNVEVSGNAGENIANTGSVCDLETVYRYEQQDVQESINASNSMEFQIESEIAPEVDRRANVNEDIPTNMDETCRHNSPKENCHVCRVQKWLLLQPPAGGSENGNPAPSLSSILPGNLPEFHDDNLHLPVVETFLPVKDNEYGGSLDERNIQEEVDSYIAEAGAMAAGTSQSSPSARVSTMYFLSQAGDRELRKGPSTSTTFRPRKTQSSLVVTPSTFLQLASQEVHSDFEEVADEQVEFGENQNSNSTYASESLSISSTLADGAEREVTPTSSTILRNAPVEIDIDSAYDPSDWEFSSPSSAIDDQEIIARFNDFSELYDENTDTGGLIDENDARFLLPLTMIR